MVNSHIKSPYILIWLICCFPCGNLNYYILFLLAVMIALNRVGLTWLNRTPWRWAPETPRLSAQS